MLRTNFSTPVVELKVGKTLILKYFKFVQFLKQSAKSSREDSLN